VRNDLVWLTYDLGTTGWTKKLHRYAKFTSHVYFVLILDFYFDSHTYIEAHYISTLYMNVLC